MDRRDVVIAGVVALVSAASWAASISYDAGQREVDSYSAGQHWARDNQPDLVACEAEMLRIAGPEVIGGSWMAGCLAAVSP